MLHGWPTESRKSQAFHDSIGKSRGTKMPISHRIDKSLGLVFTTAQGVLTEQDIRTLRQRLREDSNFDPNYDHIIDLREVVEFDISAAEMQTISNHGYIFDEGCREAIVAERDISFAMARMYEMLRGSKSGEIKVFRDMAEARRWLGLDQATNSS
jgi:hypothetical protein